MWCKRPRGRSLRLAAANAAHARNPVPVFRQVEVLGVATVLAVFPSLPILRCRPSPSLRLLRCRPSPSRSLGHFLRVHVKGAFGIRYAADP